ncbi:hypothetical protein [Klebsiella aerogenes]|uniref:hypothetical protein n=1 Tax=Klebsiella aerogenes TaxID=548 RepID=UPI0027F38F44|nr:hypothetical protein [Klebsiella aerogenes]MDT4321832.1 hypothetical protein [Klebsiella aerogenes]HDU3683144.1 hypothetical protein [Klebsiella aerogenes]HDU3702968.1 hypothetical protein [Klebsiella aerogenes]HDU3713893.1 hypothetical protein [Klebsiella aerogenes]
MDITRLLVITFTLSLAGCATHQNSDHGMKETKECMQYRSMMTAPLPPAAIDNLKEKCEQSRK